MRRLYVLYDPDCGLCVAVKRWIETQPKLVEVAMVPRDSPLGAKLLGGTPVEDDLIVIGDGRQMWRGNAAWIVVLWALRDYRAWSARLASPMLLPLARQAFAALSKNRRLLSSWLNLKSEEELARALGEVAAPGCATGKTP